MEKKTKAKFVSTLSNEVYNAVIIWIGRLEFRIDGVVVLYQFFMRFDILTL